MPSTGIPLGAGNFQVPQWMLNYGVAIAVVAAATVARFLLDKVMGDTALYTVFVLAIVITSWYGGYGPAVFATLLSLFVIWGLFLDPPFSFISTQSVQALGLSLFLVASFIIASLGGSIHRAEARKATAQELAQEQQMLLEVTLMSIGDAVITCNNDGLITAMNPRAIELTGWPFNEAYLRPLADVFSLVDEKRKPITHFDRKVREGKLPASPKYHRLTARDGRERTIEHTANPIRSRFHSTEGVVVTFRDVSARLHSENALRQSERELNDFFENAVVGLHWVGPDGVILRANRADLDLVGRTPAEYIGHHISEFHADPEVAVNILHRLKSGEKIINYPAQLRCKDGSTREVLIDSSVLWDNERFVHTCTFTRDVTQQKRIDEANRRLAAMIESSDDAIVSKNTDGFVMSWNLAAQRMFGYSAEEMVGHSILTVIPKDRRHEEDEILSRIRRGQRVEQFETLRQRRDGTLFPVSLTISPIFDENGKIIGASKIARDMTQKRKDDATLRESEATFRTIGEAVPDFLWMSDAEGHPIYQNPAWQEYTGLTSEDLVRSTWRALAHPDERPKLELIWDQAQQSGTPFEIEFRCRRHDGEYRWFLGRTVPVKDDEGKILRWVGTTVDIHARKIAEQVMRETDRRKDEFLATLAHELRNPLAPLANAMQILSMKHLQGKELEQILAMMDRQIHHLVRLVDDLLEVSRLSRGKTSLRKEVLDLKSVVTSAVETSQPLLATKRQRLNVQLPEEPINVYADSLRLVQVIANLLNNASKYSNDESAIDVSVSQENDLAQIVVHDEGIGIPADMLNHVFNMFAQVDQSLVRTHGGLGIGLTLVKNFVEMHGGTVTAQSNGPNQGSSFTVRLPLASPTETAETQPAAPSEDGPLPKHRIMVIDDTKTAAFMVSKLLQVLGQEVHTFLEAETALGAASDILPNIVFSDIAMPKLDGYDVARRLRQQFGPEIVLVALTGYGLEDDRRKAREAGFDHHLVKPVSVTALRALLRSLEKGPKWSARNQIGLQEAN